MIAADLPLSDPLATGLRALKCLSFSDVPLPTHSFPGSYLPLILRLAGIETTGLSEFRNRQGFTALLGDSRLGRFVGRVVALHATLYRPHLNPITTRPRALKVPLLESLFFD